MGQFLFGFIFYTLGAMGVLLVGYIVARKVINTISVSGSKNPRSFLNVEHGVPLEARKTMYVVKAGNQRFLVVTTPENVSCIGELNKDNLPLENRHQETRQVESRQVETRQVERPVESSFNRAIQNTPQVPQMHPDLAKTLKYQNFVKNTLIKPKN